MTTTPETKMGAARVLYVWDADYPWDVRTEKICRTLAEAGHDVGILARNRAWQPVREALPEGTVYRMPPWRFAGRRLDRALGFPAFANPRWIAHLARGIRLHRPDVLIVRDLPLCPTAIWAGRRFGVPVALDMAENYAAMIQANWDAGVAGRWDVLLRNPRAIAAVERYCLPRLDRVIVVVEESADRVAALGVPRERIAVVSNTPPRARAAGPSRPRPAGERLVVTYLGLMQVPRGVADAIEAVARIARAGWPITLRLIGDGRDRPIFERRAEDLGVRGSHVEFLGAMPNREALAAVAEADVGLVPHYADDLWNTTIPNKLFDYWAAGLPVVTSDAAPAARIVREAEAGLVFRSRDAADLAAQLERLRDPALRERLGEAGRQAVESRYNWEAASDVLLGTVRELARRRPEFRSAASR
jgi:glycosyltransferase involved in cell wall biosynthesis